MIDLNRRLRDGHLLSAIPRRQSCTARNRKLVQERCGNGAVFSPVDTPERCLTQGLDLLIGQFEPEFPVFVTEYRNARVVAEPGSKPELKIVEPAA